MNTHKNPADDMHSPCYCLAFVQMFDVEGLEELDAILRDPEGEAKVAHVTDSGATQGLHFMDTASADGMSDMRDSEGEDAVEGTSNLPSACRPDTRAAKGKDIRLTMLPSLFWLVCLMTILEGKACQCNHMCCWQATSIYDQLPDISQDHEHVRVTLCHVAFLGR
jgi:hypothetical protein